MKFETMKRSPIRVAPSFSRKAALTALAIRVITLPAIPVTAADTMSAGAVDDDPGSRIPLIGAGATDIQIRFNPEALALTGLPVSTDALALDAITIGKSRQTEAEDAARAEAERIAAEEAARVEAERVAQEAAAKKAAEEKRLAQEKERQRVLAAAAARAATEQQKAAQPSTPSAYDGYFQKYFGNDWKIARAIACAESGFSPNAVSRTNDHGIMQIHNGLVSFGAQIYDPEQNIRIAAEHYWKTRGFSPWSTYKNGAYKSAKCAAYLQ